MRMSDALRDANFFCNAQRNIGTVSYTHLLMKIVEIVAKREGIRCETEYTPGAATPQKKVSIYLSEELLTHQLSEFGIIGTEY